MRLFLLFACLAFSLLSAAQSSGNSSQTITTAPSSASQSGSASGSGSATGSGSISGSANNTSAAGNATTTAHTTSNLPTAASTVAGANGGGPNGGAPSPGTSASGGIYGPPDGYIASAEALRSAGLIGLVGFAVGGALVIV